MTSSGAQLAVPPTISVISPVRPVAARAKNPEAYTFQQEESSSSQSESMSRPSTSHEGLHLTVQPSSPSSRSLDGATLRSRSDSFRSASDSSPRTRTNSINMAADYHSFDDVAPAEALKPGKNDGNDFEVRENPFAFSPGEMNRMQNPKSLAAFAALGGLPGLEKGLRTSVTAGLSADETTLDGRVSFDAVTRESADKDYASVPLHTNSESTDHHVKGQFTDRLRVFRDNRLPEKKSPGIFLLIWRAYNDKILILLTIAAVISLSLGLYETFSGGSSVDWIEGVAIVIAIVIVVITGAANDWQKERQFMKLNKRKDDRTVKAIRSGKSIQISVFDITVGDVLHLEPGDAIPVDGVFISGHGVKCDESSATGESDQMKKTGGMDVWRQIQNGTATRKLDPFIISGSKVLEGVGTYLVTSVGENSSYGKIMMSLQTENDETPLQVKLGRLANWIGGVGSSAAILLLVILTIRFIVGLKDNDGTGAQKGHQFLDLLIVAITVIVVAVPEGLPLAVTLALAFATTRMLKENNLVRVFRACETMGNATTICSDKTGTLTQNKMTVVAGAWGLEEKFDTATHSSENGRKAASFSTLFGKLSKTAQTLLRQSFALNSTAFEGEEKGVPTFIGSKTETALLVLAKDHLGLDNLAEERANSDIVQLFPFDSARKCMGAVVRLSNGSYRLLVKGAAEIMLRQATDAVSNIYSEGMDSEAISGGTREEVDALIDQYAQHSLRTIGMLYKDFAQWPPADGKSLEEDRTMADFDSIFHNMIWVGVVGIRDPLREGVVHAVSQCQRSGVVVRMVTGDNVTTAKAIATDCGIMTEGAVVMEGPKFRQLDDAAMDKILPDLRVLARSSPEDKRILVARLKHLGETVAVTGDGTNDGPALKTADVGFSMGIAGTEVAKEASSIILLDDNFSSTITALMWGRAVNDAVKKFLQFQITVNITAVVLTFVSALADSQSRPVLSAVQLLWVNLIMDTLAALALATDPPTDKILDRPPQPKSERLITINMWKMIVGQSIYQLAVTFVLYFAGYQILGFNRNNDDDVLILNTMVFNTFVWMQIFNEFNNRRLDNKFNVFEGIHRNFWFIGINCIMVGGQIMIVFVGSTAFKIHPNGISGVQWAICLLCAAPCLLWAVLIRIFPDAWFGVVFLAVVDGSASVLRPIIKGFHYVLHPIAEGWRAMMRPIKRTTTKLTSKLHKNKTDDETYAEKTGRNSADEESQVMAHEKSQDTTLTEKTSPPSTPSPQAVPPITLTAPN